MIEQDQSITTVEGIDIQDFRAAASSASARGASDRALSRRHELVERRAAPKPTLSDPSNAVTPSAPDWAPDGAAIAFVGAALRWQHLEGQAFVLFLIAIAAAEVSVGLAMIVTLYHRTGSLDPERYRMTD